MLRILHSSHQNYHFLLAHTNHHCFLALYFCTTLQDWVLSFSDFYYEHHYIPFMRFSKITVYLICFLHHTQASCVRIHHTDFSQNMAAIYSSELTPYFISPPHIHFLHISIIAMWKFCTAAVHISFFITHIVRRSSIFLSNCVNFAYSLTNFYLDVHTAIILILYLLPNNPFLHHSSLA